MDIARPGRQRPIKCSYCGLACFNSRDLKSHMAIHAPGDSGRKADFVPRCDGCDKSFQNFEAYEAHMDLYHEGVPELVRKEEDPDASQSRRRKKRSKHKRGNQKGKDSVTECPNLEAHYRDMRHGPSIKEPDTSQSSSKEPPDASSRSRRKKHHGGASKSHKRGKKRASQTHKKDIFMECPECSEKIGSADLELHYRVIHPSTKEPDTSQSVTELVRCRCCDEPFYSWRPYRDHLLDKFWKPAADKKPGSKPYDFPVMEIFTGFESEEQTDEDSISSDVSTLSICSKDTEQRVPTNNWVRAMYCQNLDKMVAEGYDFDKDSLRDRALPPDFPLDDTENTSPEAERARIRDNNERLRMKFNLGPDDLYDIPGMELCEFDDSLSD